MTNTTRYKQDITLRHVRVTIVAMENNKYYIFWVCVCSLSYPACNVHAPYCHPWPVWLYHIFPQDLINGTIFGKMLLHIKCTFWFPTNFVWNIFHSKKKWARHSHKCTCIFMQSTCYSCQILMKLQFSWQIFKKHSTIKFHENPFSGSIDVPYEQTDRLDEANNSFLQVCEQL